MPGAGRGRRRDRAKTWRAYLSTSEVDAKDRIGSGPWYNAKGEKIADDVASLHSDANTISKQTALDEKGNVVNGRGDEPNRHDILTGTMPDGTDGADRPAANWTADGATARRWWAITTARGSTTARRRNRGTPRIRRGGCSQADLRKTGGDGLLYCFAAE